MLPARTARPAARPAYWLPLALGGTLIALSVPLYGLAWARQPAPGGWFAYAPLTRTVSSFSSTGAAYSSFISIRLHPAGGLAGIAEGWYWTAMLVAGFAVTGWWLRRAAHRAGTPGPGPGYLVTGLLLIALATVLPLSLVPAASFPAWLWLAGAWGDGTFALLAIAVALGLLAWRARSRMLAIVAAAFTAAAVLADWHSYQAAWPALTHGGAGPAAALTLMAGQQPLGRTADLLPAAVLLAAAAGARLTRRRTP